MDETTSGWQVDACELRFDSKSFFGNKNLQNLLVNVEAYIYIYIYQYFELSQRWENTYVNKKSFINGKLQ